MFVTFFFQKKEHRKGAEIFAIETLNFCREPFKLKFNNIFPAEPALFYALFNKNKFQEQYAQRTASNPTLKSINPTLYL